MKCNVVVGTLSIMLLMLPTEAYSASKAKVDVKGKVIKQVVLKDRAGRKKTCQIVVDKKTKKEYTICN